MSGALVAQAINESVGTPGFQGIDAILKEYLGLIAEQAGTARVPISRTINGHSLASDVDLTNDDVGAAPAGYGYGDMPKKILDTADDATGSLLEGALENELAKMSNSTVKQILFYDYPNIPGGYCIGTFYRHDADNAALTGVNYNTSAGSFIKKKYNGVWTPLEWVNPPMVLGVEYRTTERYNDKPVYTKLIDCKTALTGRTVQTGHATIFRHSGNLNMNHTLPYSVSNINGTYWAESRASGETLTLVCGSGFEGNYNWYEQIWWI